MFPYLPGIKGVFCCLEQDTTVERTAATLQLPPPSGAGLRPGAVLSVSPGWWDLPLLFIGLQHVWSIRLCSNRLQPQISEKHIFILSQWKDVNQCRFAPGSSNWSEHMGRVALHWLPDEGGNTIVLLERNKDFQVGVLFSCEFIFISFHFGWQHYSANNVY